VASMSEGNNHFECNTAISSIEVGFACVAC